VFIRVHSWFKKAKNGAVWDKFGVFLAHFGVIWDKFGVVWDYFGITNTPKNRIFSTKNKENTEFSPIQSRFYFTGATQKT